MTTGNSSKENRQRIELHRSYFRVVDDLCNALYEELHSTEAARVELEKHCHEYQQEVTELQEKLEDKIETLKTVNEIVDQKNAALDELKLETQEVKKHQITINNQGDLIKDCQQTIGKLTEALEILLSHSAIIANAGNWLSRGEKFEWIGATVDPWNLTKNKMQDAHEHISECKIRVDLS